MEPKASQWWFLQHGCLAICRYRKWSHREGSDLLGKVHTRKNWAHFNNNRYRNRIPSCRSSTHPKTKIVACPWFGGLAEPLQFLFRLSRKLSRRKKYKLLLAVWDEEHVHVSSGRVHIEFCGFNIKTYSFIGYCTTCEEMEREIRKGPKVDDTGFSIEDLFPFWYYPYTCWCDNCGCKTELKTCFSWFLF